MARRRYFEELEPFKAAIDGLRKPDPLTRELFARDDDARKSAADQKRERKAAKRLQERSANG